MRIPVFLLLVCLSSLSASSQNSYDYIDSLLTHYRKNDLFNGTVLIADKGEMTYSRNIGYADFPNKVKLTNATPMPLSSNTKPFTTMAIMILKERELLKYDDFVTKYLKTIPYEDMTISHLMTSTSGLKRLYPKAANGDELITIQELIDFCSEKKPKLAFTPGDKYLSSAAGYSLLAGIVEVISGQPFGQFLNEEIFQPLEMKNTFLLTEETWQWPRATGYDQKNREKEWFLGSYNGGVGVYSSAPDLLKWDQALYTEKLVSSESIELAYRSVTLNDESTFNNGFGWRKWKGKENLIFKNGTWVANNSILFRDIENNFTIILLANRQNKVSNWQLIDEIHSQFGYLIQN